MGFQVLGPLTVTDDEGATIEVVGARQRAVLAFLLTRPGKVISVDQLIDGVWGAELPKNPRTTVQIAVSRLRKALDSESIVSRGLGYLIRVVPDDLDAMVFERLTTEARRAIDAGRFESAVERYDQALELWRGEAYADFAYEDFARGERERLHEMRFGAVEDRIRALLELGNERDVLPDLESLVEQHPLRERLWHHYMLALYRADRQADAVRAYQRAAAELAEIGLDVGTDLATLEDRILRRDPTLQPREATAADASDVSTLSLAVVLFDHLEGELPPIALHGGTPFRRDAAGVWFAFADASVAVAAAAGAAAELNDLRIGIHTGTATHRHGDYVGLAVWKAGRIAAAARPGQVLVSAATAQAMAETPPGNLVVAELGEVRLPGITSPEALREVHRIDAESSSRSIDAITAPPTNLPAQTSTFVGRSTDIAELTELLQHHRVVTLTGPGGIGKTRLALQVAANQVGKQRHGAWMIELAPLTDGRLIAAATAEALGVVELPDSSVEQSVGTFLRSRDALLVFDNCEHVIDAAAEFIIQLVSQAEHVRVLATSRERLGIDGEHAWLVPTMQVAAPGTVEPSTLLDSEPVILFADRAQNVNADLLIDESNVATVARICRRLDGIPFAIELAAARAGTMTLEDILSRLDDRFSLLTSRRRGVLPRQRTLASLLDWSWQLLSKDEQRLLRRLSVFRDTFDLEAATEVCAFDDLDPTVLAAVLADLVEKSLVVADLEGETSMFGLLTTTAEFATSHLGAAGEIEEASSRHAAYFRRLAAHASSAAEGSRWPQWLDRLDRSHNDFRSAVAWAGDNEEPSVFLEFVCDLQWFWLRRGHLREGLASSESALALTTELGSDLRSLVLGRAAALAGAQFAFRRSEELLAERLAYERSHGMNPVAIGSTLVNASNVAMFQGQLRRAAAQASDALQLLEKDDADSPLARADRCATFETVAEIAIRRGAYEEARKALDVSLEWTNAHHAMFSNWLYGELELDALNLDRAVERYERSLEHATEVGEPDREALVHVGLAKVALTRGDVASARNQLDAAERRGSQLEAAWSRPEYYDVLTLTSLVSGADGEAAAGALIGITTSVSQNRLLRVASSIEDAGLVAASAGNWELGSCLLESSAKALTRCGFAASPWRALIRRRLDLPDHGVPAEAKPLVEAASLAVAFLTPFAASA